MSMLRTAIAKRVYIHHIPGIANIRHSPFISPLSTADVPDFHHHLLTSPETCSSSPVAGFFRRLYHWQQLNNSPRLSLPGLFYLPAGEKLNISDSKLMRTDCLRPPSASDSGGFSVRDARKIMRCSQLENVRSTLKLIPANSITYTEFVNICSNACENRDQGVEFAKLLDVAGDVLVLGNVVFLRPDQVAKSMEKVISQSIAIPNDPRKQELEELERQLALIDQKAISQVRCELYFGLGFIVLQTLGFMRLTFWELSWDVMEPICFFVTSFHFAVAYMFFLRTSKEPTFEGYFQQRFRAKQTKLMGFHKFDYERYKELCNVFYPDYQSKFSFIMRFCQSGRSRRAFG